MKRKRVILLFLLSVAVLSLSLFAGTLLPGEGKVSESNFAVIVVLPMILSFVSILYTSSVIMFSMLAEFLLRIVGPEIIARKSGNPLYYFVWREVNLKIDEYLREGEVR